LQTDTSIVRPYRQLSNADQPHPKQPRGCRFRPGPGFVWSHFISRSGLARFAARARSTI